MASIFDYLQSGVRYLDSQFRLRRGVSVRTLDAAATFTARTANVCAWDPGGASRNVTMPAEETCDGLVVWFKNTADAAENLVVKDDAGSTIVTVGQGEFAMVACTGGAWTFTKSSVAAYGDNTPLNLGDGNDIVATWDGTRLNITQATPNSEIRWGVDGAGIDQMWYGDTASAYLQWDQSADALVFGGTAALGVANRTIGGSTAAAGTTNADAGALPAGTAPVYPTTGADGTKGVIVSTSDKVTGRMIFIGNGVSNQILKVYPPSGGTINGAAANAAFSSTSGKGVIMVCLSSGANTWLAW